MKIRLDAMMAAAVGIIVAVLKLVRAEEGMFRYGSPIRAAILAAALALAWAAPAWADYDAGRRAWDAGRHGEALSAWRAAADRDDARAMLALGRLFIEGLGAPQDYVRAHMWLNLAASRGDAAALTERDALAARMTPAQVAVAQERAAAWRPGAGEAAEAVQAGSVAPEQRTDSQPVAGPPPEHAVREAQSLLAALGYEPGPADGVWGRRTGQAYRAFLRDAGLPAADELTPDALRDMRGIAKQRGVSATAPLRAGGADAVPRAAKRGDIDGVKAALTAGADADARDRSGWTALMYAADKGYTLMIAPLLAAGADPDARAADGATALFIAALHGHAEIVAALAKAGADLSIQGPKGLTATDAARRHRDPDLVNALFEVGRVFRDCASCPEMVVVPAGSFEMGSPSGEKGRISTEGPVHRVTIQEPLAVGRYEVTFDEWDVCVRNGGCGGYRPHDRGWGRGSRPVIRVSWNDANSYVRWLSRETGEAYRLLSESEWEYAARAGTRTPFHTGPTISPDQANHNGSHSYGSGGRGLYRQRTMPAGSFSPNGFGLHDAHGNVREWVADCWHSNYAGAPSDGSAWMTGGDCHQRVVRGGSWWNTPDLLRSAHRGKYNVKIQSSDFFGFRVARTLN